VPVCVCVCVCVCFKLATRPGHSLLPNTSNEQEVLRRMQLTFLNMVQSTSLCQKQLCSNNQ